MSTVIAKLNNARKNLESAMKKASRELMVVGVMESIAELRTGEYKTYRSGSALMKDVKNKK